MDEIEKYINLIRESVPEAEKIFMNGRCVQFYFMLRDRFSDYEVKPYYLHGHIFSFINGRFYDIMGKYNTFNKEFPIKVDENILRKWHRWKNNIKIEVSFNYKGNKDDNF